MKEESVSVANQHIGPGSNWLSEWKQRVVTPLTVVSRMMLLLLFIVLALLSTTVLVRSYQIFLLKAFLVTFLSILPGWLYLHFIRTKGTALYDEYVLNLYRLRIDSSMNLPKPPPGSSYWQEWSQAIGDAPDSQVTRNIYLRKFESVYGPRSVPNSRRIREAEAEAVDSQDRGSNRLKDAFSPVVLLTALLAVGWILVVQPELFRRLEPFGPMVASGLPKAPVEAIRFGFIGSYVFILQGMVRRYFQLDLKTHAYVSAISRIVVVTGLLVVLGPFMTKATEAVTASVAFLIGMFPELGIRLIKQAAGTLARSLSRDDDERFQLTDIDGLNVWTRARLFEEGIEDMQNLTTANIPDLLLNTRVPIGRLLDWMDQAFLYLRVSNKPRDQRASKRGTDRDVLRRYGIRTATDLLDMMEEQSTSRKGVRARFSGILNDSPDPSANGLAEPSVTEGISQALDGEVNLWHIREWKKAGWLKDPEHSNIGGPPGSRRGRPADGATHSVAPPTVVPEAEASAAPGK